MTGADQFRSGKGGPVAPETIRQALSFIPADDYFVWVNMGMAVKSELGDGGFAVWDEWSQSAENYNATSAKTKWRSFKDGATKIGSLLYEAKQRGFKLNGQADRIDPQEIERYRRERAEAQAKEEAADKRRRSEASDKAATLLDAATAAEPDHPYLQRKGIEPQESMREILATAVARIIGYAPAQDGVALAGRLLIVPITMDGNVSSVEMIDETGRKSALAGGAKRGGYFPFGTKADLDRTGTLCIGEGVATGASLHAAGGFPTVAAFDAGNIEPVARAMRAKYPDIRIIICADDDYRTKGNPGLTRAREAARAIGALLAVPDFGNERPEGATDFNDMAVVKGADAVRAALEAARLPEEIEAAPTTGTPPAGAPARAVEASPKLPQASRDAVPPVALNGNVELGAELLDAIHGFLGRFVAYPSEHAQIAHALWIAHSHLMDAWESTPRIAFLSPEPGSGKTRALEITETLVPRPVESVNATSAYLFRKISDEEGPPTLLYDEIDTVFGPKAKDNEDIRGILNAGHRRGATAGRCVVHGKTISTEELPAYCAVAMAGLGALPDTILTRSVLVRMRRRAPSEVVEPYRRRIHAPQGNALRDRLANWARAIVGSLGGAWPEMPTGIADRDADVWEALLAIADAVGGTWPARAREAAVALVADGKRSTPSLGVRLLSDLRAVFGERASMPTDGIIKALVSIEEAPWADLRGKPVDARRLAAYLRPYGVSSKNVRIGPGPNDVAKGYAREDLHDPWTRYLGLAPGPDKSATSATDATDGGAEVIE